MSNEHGDKYDESKFWKIVRGVGRAVAEPALLLYYAMDDAPAWAKSIIIGALGYLVWPLDAIPDITPVIGYTDDIGVMTAAIATVSAHITDDVKRKANEVLKNIFG